MSQRLPFKKKDLGQTLCHKRPLRKALNVIRQTGQSKLRIKAGRFYLLIARQRQIR